VLFRVAQEALTNVVKHAQATQVDLSLGVEPEHIELRINDNGQGFDLAALRALPREGIGLRNMRERLAAIGGRFDVHSDVARHPQDPQHGTLVLAT
ncbi:ATP-binding protein, partial [Acinetobacter baumannii]